MARRWDEGIGVVTPEAVPLQFPEANVGSRAISYLLDISAVVGILILLNVTIGYLYDGSGAVPGWVAITALVLVNFAVYLGYPIAFETLWRGRTPGKAALGLRVVTVEGAPVRFRHAAIRAALGMVDFFITSGIGALATALFSKRHQRLGDMVAGTVVLRERTAGPPPRAATFSIPPGAEAYASTIDTAGLLPGDYEAVREFLLRTSTLRPDVRNDIGRRLATAIAAKLHHTAPPSVSPELFLVCVAARHQQRGRHLAQHGAAEHSDSPHPSALLYEPAPAPADAPAAPPPEPPSAPAGGFAPPQ